MDRAPTETSEATSDVVRNNVKKLRVYDLIGKKFFKLLVVEVIDDGNPPGVANVLCKCDCGKTTSVMIKNLKDKPGGTQSCGCQRASFNATKLRDLTGSRVGKLTVMHEIAERVHGRVMWMCKCDCGVVKAISSGTLTTSKKRYKTTSCGCGHAAADAKRRRSLEGMKFGRLRAIERVVTKGGLCSYICECECGRMSKVRFSNLTSGATKSCGCLRDDLKAQPATRNPGRLLKLPDCAGLWNVFARSAERGAQKRGIEWGLGKDRAIELMKMPCVYCGVGFSRKKTSATDTILANGIDRIDNAKGYIDGNCAPCCTTCNRAKQSMGVEEFMLWVIRVFKVNDLSTERRDFSDTPCMMFKNQGFLF